MCTELTCLLSFSPTFQPGACSLNSPRAGCSTAVNRQGVQGDYFLPFSIWREIQREMLKNQSAVCLSDCGRLVGSSIIVFTPNLKLRKHQVIPERIKWEITEVGGGYPSQFLLALWYLHLGLLSFVYVCSVVQFPTGCSVCTVLQSASLF